MSAWFQTPKTTFTPSASRTIGFGQVPVGGPAFEDEVETESPQMSAASGGVVQNFSMTGAPPFSLNFRQKFDGPYFTTNAPVFNNQLTNNINQNLDNSAWMQAIFQKMQLFFGGAPDLTARVAALETWRQTGAVSCGTGEIPVLEDWYYDSTEDPDNILKQRFRIQIQDGLITFFSGSQNVNTASHDVACTTNNTLDGLEPISTCP